MVGRGVLPQHPAIDAYPRSVPVMYTGMLRSTANGMGCHEDTPLPVHVNAGVPTLSAVHCDLAISVLAFLAPF